MRWCFWSPRKHTRNDKVVSTMRETVTNNYRAGMGETKPIPPRGTVLFRLNLPIREVVDDFVTRMPSKKGPYQFARLPKGHAINRGRVTTLAQRTPNPTNNAMPRRNGTH